jgi:hypothetical protein
MLHRSATWRHVSKREVQNILKIKLSAICRHEGHVRATGMQLVHQRGSLSGPTLNERRYSSTMSLFNTAILHILQFLFHSLNYSNSESHCTPTFMTRLDVV